MHRMWILANRDGVRGASQIRNTGRMTSDSTRLSGFSEKEFYLAEFRGRTLAVAFSGSIAQLDLEAEKKLREVFDDLESSGVRVILLAGDPEWLVRFSDASPLVVAQDDWTGDLWQCLRECSRVSIQVPDRAADLPALCRSVCLRLRLAKLVWLGPEGVLEDELGRRISLLDLAGLRALLSGESSAIAVVDSSRKRLLEGIEAMIAGGLPSVSACRTEGFADELFTYEGSGTFYSRERYTEVRALALDEFDAAAHLIGRGVSEGFLLSRGEDELRHILSNALGAFIEGRYLAGIGALLPDESARASEIASLYTLTRFVGEGVGRHLVRDAIERTREREHEYLYACTTSPRVEAFFERNGFRVVTPGDIPQEKWRNYSAERMRLVRVLRHDLD